MTIVDDVQTPPAEPQAAQPEAAEERLDPRVISVWRAAAAIGWLVWIGVATAALLLVERSALWALVLSAMAVPYVMLVPEGRYRHYGYRVGGSDVRVTYGWLWRTESVVLHSRIQHVDTRQGPIERMMGLATVVIFTAGSVGAMVRIPGLAAGTADALRDRLVQLSGTGDAV